MYSDIICIVFNFSEDINLYIDNNKNRLKLNKKGNPLFGSVRVFRT